MRILHILDHSIPLQSGYTFRTLSILEQQRARGWDTFHLTSAKHTRPFVASEEVEGWRFYRTPPATGLFSSLPVLSELALMRGTERRLLEVIDEVRPDILHAHSPLLNAIPAIRAGRSQGLPVVYEVRAFWEDAAASHGTAREGGARSLMPERLLDNRFPTGAMEERRFRTGLDEPVPVFPALAVEFTNFNVTGAGHDCLQPRCQTPDPSGPRQSHLTIAIT